MTELDWWRVVAQQPDDDFAWSSFHDWYIDQDRRVEAEVLAEVRRHRPDTCSHVSFIGTEVSFDWWHEREWTWTRSRGPEYSIPDQVFRRIPRDERHRDNPDYIESRTKAEAYAALHTAYVALALESESESESESEKEATDVVGA